MDRNHSHYSHQSRNQFSSPSNPSGGQNKRKAFYRLVHHTPEWTNISQAFEPIASGKAKLHEVYATIEDCMNRYSSANFQTNVLLLEQFIGFLPAKQQDEWEKEIFPGLAKMILKTPELFPDDITVPLLLQRSQETVRLTKEQCFCLLANMFMCTTLDNQEKYLPKPYNFSRILTLEDPKQSPLRAQKLHCLYDYFRQALKSQDKMTFVIFRRLVHDENLLGKCDLKDWTTCRTGLLPVEIKPKGGIEEAKGCLEIDFANKYLGGGVLGNGATQEEIMMITSPESLVGILFCESMRPEEAIMIQGAAMLCNYKGFSRSFKFDGNKEDNYKINSELNVVDRDIIAIDALDLRDEKLPPQFSEELILRELNKAYVGFYGVHKAEEETRKKPVATGKWGCGVFAGNLHLKFILQWVAASRAGRAMVFYSFEDKGLQNVENIIKFYEGKDIGEILRDVLECAKDVGKKYDDRFDLFNALKGLRFSDNNCVDGIWLCYFEIEKNWILKLLCLIYIGREGFC